jgi:hypothetical protein
MVQIDESAANTYSPTTINLGTYFDKEQLSRGVVLKHVQVIPELIPSTASAANKVVLTQFVLASSAPGAIAAPVNEFILFWYRLVTAFGAAVGCVNSVLSDQWPSDGNVMIPRRFINNTAQPNLYAGIQSANDTVANDVFCLLTFDLL